MKLNGPSPDFSLPGLDGELVTLSGLRGKIVIVNFWSCECPHAERTDRDLMAMFVQWRDDVVLLSVASNSIESVPALQEAARRRHIPLVLRDADHSVADLFEAETTPHAFVIDRDGILRYRGAVDNTSFLQRRPTRFFLEEAVEALLAGRLPELAETPSYGCAIVREALE